MTWGGERVGVGGQAEPKHNKYDKMSKVTCERQLIMLVSLNVPHVAHTHTHTAYSKGQRVINRWRHAGGDSRKGNEGQRDSAYGTAKCLCINTDNKSRAIKI